MCTKKDKNVAKENKDPSRKMPGKCQSKNRETSEETAYPPFGLGLGSAMNRID